MRSDMGGTEISLALGWIFGNRQQNTPMSVIVLTDGEVIGFILYATASLPNLTAPSLGMGTGASHRARRQRGQKCFP